MESDENNNERYIQKLENHIDSTKDAVKYSLERFDILIISLSTSGLILSIGFVKNIINDFDKVNLTLLKISWLLFALALISNLFSQVTGYFANKKEIRISINLIRKKRGKSIKGNQDKMEKSKKIFDSFTNWLNGVCLACLILAIVIKMYG